jgi:hypothetical protein
MTVLDPKHISRLLNRSERWVYTHAHELGARRIGRTWIFTQEGLESAILRPENEEVDRHYQPARKTPPAEIIRNKTRSQGRSGR